MGIWDDISASLLPSATITTSIGDQQQSQSQSQSQSTSRRHSQQIDINQQENRDHENALSNPRAILGAGFRSMSASYSPTPSITLGEVNVDSYQPL